MAGHVGKRRARPGNRREGAAFSTAKAPLNDSGGSPVQRERTPTESRSGVVSGRVFLVLISSFVGAVIALGVVWAVFLRP
jgi:hypothetical protein